MAEQEPPLQVLSRRVPETTDTDEAIVVTAAVVTVIGAVGFVIALLLSSPLWVYGSLLAMALFALATGIRRYFAAGFPDVEAIEPRAQPVGARQDQDNHDGHDDHEDGATAGAGAIAEVHSVGRRPFLTRMLLGAGGVFAVSLLALVPSLGPSPGDALVTTRWTRGRRLVTSGGMPLRPDDIVTGGINTVWPEGAIGDEYSAVILVRLPGEAPQPPTRLEWVVNDELIAYSKVCTHAGCPVGLFRERDAALFCPCHQSTFDAARGAIPTFGPTARALPQLPMGLDDEGYLIALGDFQAQVGPAFG